MARKGRKSQVSFVGDFKRAPLMPAGQQRCRTTTSNYGDRFITERNPDSSFLDLTPTKPKSTSTSASPSHVTRIALATSLQPPSHTLDLSQLIQYPSIAASPLATPLPAHPLQTRYHVPAGTQSVRRRKLLHVRPERVLEAPFMRGDDEGCIQLVTWSSSGLLVGLDNRAFLWNNVTIGAAVVTTLPEDRDAHISSLEWCPRLSTLAMLASDGIITLVDPSRGNAQVDLGTYGFGNRAVSMCLVDGLVAVGQADGFVTLFDRRTPALTSGSVRAHSAGVSRISASVDGNNIATSGEKSVMVWDRRYMATSNVQPLWSKRGLTRTIKAFAWCPWHTAILAMGEGADSQSLQCWNINSDELKSTTTTSSPIKTIQFAPLAKQIVTTHGHPENSIQIHRYPLMKKVATSASNHLDPVSYAAINPRGDVVATGSADETIRFWRFWEAPPRRTWHPSERNIIRSTQMLR